MRLTSDSLTEPGTAGQRKPNLIGHKARQPRIAVKLPADLVGELRHTYPDSVSAARPLDQRYWVTIRLDAPIPDSELSELLTDSYREVLAHLPRSLRPSARETK